MLDPYFSATKLRWILEHIPDGLARARRGELAFGTVDSWLVWNLTGGRLHVTDATNASRTLLYDIHAGAWDDELLELFGVPRELLPDDRRHERRGRRDRAGAVRQGAAHRRPVRRPAGGAVRPGVRQRPARPRSPTGPAASCSPTPARRRSRRATGCSRRWPCNATRRRTFALEGSAFVGGAAIDWLRDGLGVLASSAQASELAARVGAGEGGVFVPALAGLGAPHWDPAARGAFFGLTLGATPAHLARAVLEGIAFQVADLVAATAADAGVELVELRADGGASVSDVLLQFQADILGVPVARAAEPESTALGAACLAGLAVGLWRDAGEVEGLRRPGRRFEPDPAIDREPLLARWRRAVTAVREFAAGGGG